MEKKAEEKEISKPAAVCGLVFSPDAVPEETAPGVLPKKKHRFRSIRFNLWLIFVLMTILVLGIVWIFEIIFYSTFYVGFQRNEISRTGGAFTSEYFEAAREGADAETLQTLINDYAASANVNIIVFNVDDYGEPVNVVSATVGGITAAGLEGALYDYYLENLDSGHSFVSDTTGLDLDYDVVFYGYSDKVYSKEDGISIMTYVYLSSELPSFSPARSTLAGQLVVITVACLVISALVAFFGSGVAARPMRNLADKVTAPVSGNGKRKPLATDTKFAEINELSAAFNYAFAEAEKNNRFRRDLLANVSHDMKTPLTMIRAYSEMIRDISGGNKEKCAKQAQVIMDETDRLTALINEVVELSKLEAGVLELNQSVFDISAQLGEAVKRFGIMEETKGYEFKSDIAPDLLVRGDREKIDRVIYNLIGNAMNYTGADKLVMVRCRAKGNFARVEIADTGKGMTNEELRTVWDKYYRLAQDKRRVVGSGLGLSIVKSILELHKTTFGVDSEKGKGSVFWFELPLVN